MLGGYLLLLKTVEDKRRFEELYSLYHQDMLKIAMMILKNKYDAEDAVHEAFLSAIRNFTKISQINCPETRSYLIVIVRNFSRKICNRRKRIAETGIDEMYELSSDDSLEDDVIFKISVDDLINCLREISETYCDVLILEQINGLTPYEISMVLDIPYETARKRLQRAKQKIIAISKKKELEFNGI